MSRGRRPPYKRLTNGDMTAALASLSQTTNHTQDFSYDRANSGWKLVRDGGAWEVSGRLTKREMYDWIWAYIYGIQDGQKIFINSLKSYEVLPK